MKPYPHAIHLLKNIILGIDGGLSFKRAFMLAYKDQAEFKETLRRFHKTRARRILVSLYREASN